MEVKTFFKVYAVGYLIAVIISFCLYFHTLYVSQEIKRVTINGDILARYKSAFSTKEFLLINFWMVDCKSCNASMQSFDDLLKKYASNLEIWSAAVESPRQLEIALDEKNGPWHFLPPKNTSWKMVDITNVQDVASSVNNNLVGSYLLIDKSGMTLIGSGNSLFQTEKILSNGGFPGISLVNAIRTLDYKIAFVVVTGSYAIIAVLATILALIFFKVILKKNINKTKIL